MQGNTAGQSFLGSYNEYEKRGNTMDVKLSDIVKTTYCYYDLYSGCVKGLETPNDAVCGKCVAAAHIEIIRSNGRNGNGTR